MALSVGLPSAGTQPGLPGLLCACQQLGAAKHLGGPGGKSWLVHYQSRALQCSPDQPHYYQGRYVTVHDTTCHCALHMCTTSPQPTQPAVLQQAATLRLSSMQVGRLDHRPPRQGLSLRKQTTASGRVLVQVSATPVCFGDPRSVHAHVQHYNADSPGVSSPRRHACRGLQRGVPSQSPQRSPCPSCAAR